MCAQFCRHIKLHFIGRLSFLIILSLTPNIFAEYVELKTGEVVEGSLISVSPTTMKIQTKIGTLEIERANIKTISVENPLSKDISLPYKEPSQSKMPLNSKVEKKPDEKIELANPFYLPYARTFQISIGAGYFINRLRTDISKDQSTTKGIVKSGSGESIQTITSVNASMNYGIFDRLAIGIEGSYFANSTSTYNGLGSLQAAGPSIPRQIGVTEPTFNIAGRLGGINQNQIYLDIIATYRPGVKSPSNLALTQQHQIAAGTQFGIQAGVATIGIAALYKYTPATDNAFGYFTEGHALRAIGVLQFDAFFGYARFSFGAESYLNSEYLSKPLTGQIMYSAGIELGCKITDYLIVNIGSSYYNSVFADLQDGTRLQYYQKVGPGIGFSANVVTRF